MRKDKAGGPELFNVRIRLVSDHTLANREDEELEGRKASKVEIELITES